MKDPQQRLMQPAVLLIDGQCLLCNRITRFVAKRDQAVAFQFAALQSGIGQQLLAEGHLPVDDINTFVMVQDGRYYTKSDAALRVFRRLGGLWPLLYVFRIVPRGWRNVIYDFVARNRYRWFGMNDACILPSQDVRSRFLENGIKAEAMEARSDEESTDLR